MDNNNNIFILSDLNNSKWDKLPIILIPEEELIFPISLPNFAPYDSPLRSSDFCFDINLSSNTKYSVYAMQAVYELDKEHDLWHQGELLIRERYFVLMVSNLPDSNDINEGLLGNIGVLCLVSDKLFNTPSECIKRNKDTLTISVMPLRRVYVESIKIDKYLSTQPGKAFRRIMFAHNVQTLDTINDILESKITECCNNIKYIYESCFENQKNITTKIYDLANYFSLEHNPYSALEHYIDFILTSYKCTGITYRPALRYMILSERSLRARYDSFMRWHAFFMETLEINSRIESKVLKQIELNNQEYYLRERLKVIRSELNLDQSLTDDLDNRIHLSHMSEEGKKKAFKELERLKNLNASGPDFDVCRNYIETLLSLPWGVLTPELTKYSLENIKTQLDKSHSGLDNVKKRIIEYVALRKRRLDNKASNKNPVTPQILCFVGPPGIGKTTIAQSIATVLHKKCARIALGGMSDESEVRGHRRTYIGANVGTFVDKIINLGVDNPVIILDEIDKITRDSYKGNVSASLLEILDSSQNHSFRDWFLDVPYDFSKVFFIATANTKSILPALLDRLEIIEIKGYTEKEKLHIALKHILPRLKKEYLLTSNEVHIPPTTITHIINHYTFESGVRNLKRNLEAICRKVITILEEAIEPIPISIHVDNITQFLGKPKINPDEFKVIKVAACGRVNGLAYNASGIGSIVPIEALVLPGQGKVTITGNLGKVMHESVVLSKMVIQSLLHAYQLPTNTLAGLDLCIHFPQAGIVKDGPSAGVGICLAILSAVTNKKILPHIGVTGEIDLHGDILPVGGINEKISAAIMAKLKTVYIPYSNRYDLEELPEAMKSKIKIHLAKNINEVIKNVLI